MQPDENTALFLQHRTLLRRLAYRMLGSASLAEDAVQETWLRWHSMDATQVESEKAWLITTLSRICIDELRRLKREQAVYIGPWLPEPLFKAATKAVQGTRAVSRLLMGIQKQLQGGYYALLKKINDEFGIAGYWLDRSIHFTMSFGLSEQGIASIFIVNNPDKLGRLTSGWLSER